MKKMYSFMVAAVASLAAISCTQELENNTPVGHVVTFEASVDGADSKAILDGKISKWDGEELITIHDGSKPFTFYTNATEPTTKAIFTYEGDDFTATEVMAMYPSGDYSADISNKTVSNVVIPDYQTLVSGTYPATAAVAVAYSNNKSLSFKNATTLLKFKVADDNITKGAFYADAGSGNLTGVYELNYNDGSPTLIASDAKQWVDFGLENEAAFSTEATYYVAVAPATFSTGFGISLNGIEIKKYEAPYKLERNVILDLGTLSLPEASQNWSICGTINEWGDTDMTLEGDWFVAKEQTITTADRFKFRADHDWTQNRGTATLVNDDTEYEVTQNGSDIYVAASAIYDVYLSKDLNKMKIIKVGDVDEPEVPEVSDGKTIYLNTGGSTLWDQGGAQFVAWIWGEGDQWVSFTATSESGIYSVVVPQGTTGMICMRKGSSMKNGWTKGTNYWNRTKGDITLDSKNYITITGWDNGDGNCPWSLSTK